MVEIGDAHTTDGECRGLKRFRRTSERPSQGVVDDRLEGRIAIGHGTFDQGRDIRLKGHCRSHQGIAGVLQRCIYPCLHGRSAGTF